MPIEIVDFTIKMLIFRSYVNSPEGNSDPFSYVSTQNLQHPRSAI